MDSNPIKKMLQQSARANAVSFHMPGHKGKANLLLPFMPQWDTTELDSTDNLANPQQAIATAQQLMASACGSAQTYMLVNGATVGVLAMLLGCLSQGDTVIVQRDCHQSVMHACVLGGFRPVYVYPAQSGGMATVVTAQDVQLAIHKNPHAKAVVVTHPTYTGLCCDLLEIAKITKAHNMLLCVDEAHGAHFPYHAALPPSAGLYADFWVQSMHKTLPVYNQCALLHINNMAYAQRMRNTLNMLQTSSPSFVFLAAMDAARALMQHKGAQLLQFCMEQTARLRRYVNQNTQFGMAGEALLSLPGVAYYDQTRLVLQTGNTAYTGFEVARLLSAQGIVPEMATTNSVVFICTVADEAADYAVLQYAISSIPHKPAMQRQKTIAYLPHEREQILTPTQAFAQPQRKQALQAAAGYICARPVGVYPPGIPLIMPGEMVTPQDVEYLIAARQNGAQLFNAQPDETIWVVDKT